MSDAAQIIGAILIILSVIALIIGIAAGVAAIFMLLWNWLMPMIFGLPVLTFWQAWGLWILLGLIGGLFKSSTKS